MIIYGTRPKRIFKAKDNENPCPKCGEYGREISIFRRYFHLYYVPFWPTSKKILTSKCPNCNCEVVSPADPNLYFSQARTPFYFWIGSFVVLLIALSLMTLSKYENEQKAEYVNAPQVGDVYLMQDKITNTGDTVYYFVRVNSVDDNAIGVNFGKYEYSRAQSKMDKKDSFNLEKGYIFWRKDLEGFLKEGTIHSVKRNESMR